MDFALVLHVYPYWVVLPQGHPCWAVLPWRYLHWTALHAYLLEMLEERKEILKKEERRYLIFQSTSSSP